MKYDFLFKKGHIVDPANDRDLIIINRDTSHF